MGRIIFSIVSLILLAVIIVMNMGTVASFNLFGWQFDELPIIVIAIVSFAAGAVYSFVLYIASYFARSRREKLAMQKQQLKSQEQTIKGKNASIKERDKQVDAGATEQAEERRALPSSSAQGGAEPFGARRVGSGKVAGGTAAGAGRQGSRSSGGWLKNLFGRKTNSGR